VRKNENKRASYRPNMQVEGAWRGLETGSTAYRYLNFLNESYRKKLRK